MNNKGFTLIELLATIALLAILMMMAVPNIIGVVNKNRNKTYVEDAKKLVSLAEYKIRSNSDYKPTSSSGAYCFKMKFLDSSSDNFSSPPGGGCYDNQMSYVMVTWSNSKLNYKVQLVERKTYNKTTDTCEGNIKAGIKEVEHNDLFNSDATKKVTTTGFVTNPTCSLKN